MRHATQEQEMIMNACFNQEIPRNCGSCIASPQHGGTCCFGDNKKLYQDSYCRDKCIHEDECKEEVDKLKRKSFTTKFSQPQSAPQQLIQIGGVRTPLPPAVMRPVGSLSPAVQPMVQTLAVRPAQVVAAANAAALAARTAQPAQEDSLHVVFVKKTLWGALEGFFTRGAEFFRYFEWK